MIENKLYFYKAKIIRVIDGDTLDLDIDLGMGVRLRERIRLYGINTPEIHGVKKGSKEYLAGINSKNYVENWANEDVIVETIKDKKGKYGRYLAKIWILLENTDEQIHYFCLNDKLLQEGLAKPYE